MKRLQDAIADEIEDRKEVCDFEMTLSGDASLRPRKRAARLIPSGELDKPMNTILDFLTEADGELDIDNIISNMNPDDTIETFVEQCLSHSEWSFICPKANLEKYTTCDRSEARELLLACFEIVGDRAQFAQEICVYAKDAQSLL